MQKFFLVLGLCVLMMTAFGSARAQVFDPNCYFPRVGVAGEIDTIYGSHNEQKLSSDINIGPAPDSSGSRILMYGLPENPPFATAINTGTGFNLHNRKISAKTTINLGANAHRTGHFRSPRYTDLFDETEMRIYWSDEAGNFDSSRYTYLSANFVGASVHYCIDNSMTPYVEKMSQDTVDDIVIGVTAIGIPVPPDSLVDSMYFVHYRGGADLYSQGKIAYCDSAVPIKRYKPRESPLRITAQGDWRGTGREDLLAGDVHGNLFFYRNIPPFSFREMVQELVYDTVWAQWQNPDADTSVGVIGEVSVTMAALPRTPGQKAKDLITAIPSRWQSMQHDARYNNFIIFRGGSDFGSHRWTIDSSSLLIRSGWSSFGKSFVSCGNMIDSNNPVILYVTASDDQYSQFFNFYVLGNSLDDKIDMEYQMDGWPTPTWIDTADVNGDGLTDVIIGIGGYVSPSDNDKGWRNVGTIHVVYGSKRIPVRKNGVLMNPQPEQARISVNPNPARSDVSVSCLLADYSGEVQVTVRDVLGRTMYSHPIRSNSPSHSIHLEVSNYPSGTYRVSIDGVKAHLASSFVVTK